jgi:hexosaminidase
MVKNIPIFLFFLFVIFSCDNRLKEFSNTKEDYLIIPKTKSLQILDGRFSINNKTQVSGDASLVFEGNYLAQLLSNASGHNITFKTKKDGNINLKLDSSLTSEEAYILWVTYDKVIISGKSPKAIFYGIQTLRQLLPPEIESTKSNKELTIPAAMIKDAPRYAYRGMHLDVARHFFPVDFIKRYINIMAMHKMNTFHWHLTEDQGWRIEIKKYPRLTEIGAWRNGTIEGHYPGIKNDNTKHGGFYTQEEIKDIIAYAEERHITIIPEIELPGHSSAAIAAYPFLSCFPEKPSVVPNNMMSELSRKAQQNGNPKIVQESWGIYDDVYCAGKEETFAFIENVLEEVMELFPSTYIHIGGDECPKENWKKCPECQKRKKEHGLENEHQLQSYFINRVEKYVNSRGKNIIGWDEILEGGLAPNATVMSWRGNSGGIEASRANHHVIMSPNTHCYFDHYQSLDRENEPIAIGGYLSVEKVYSFDPIPEELEKDKHKYILGGQANMWTEYISTEDYLEYMLLPRMTALSEVLWSSKDTKSWPDFKFRLNHFKDRYDAMGLNYAKHIFKSSIEH